MSRFIPNRLSRLARPGSSLTVLATILVLSIACGGADSPGKPEALTEGAPADQATNEVSPIELEFWQSVKDSNDADQLLAYIKKYPQGQFTELAESRLKNLSAGGPQSDPNVAGPGASNVDPPKSQASPRTQAPPQTRSPKDEAPPPKTSPAPRSSGGSKSSSAPSSRRRSPQDRVLDVVNRSLRKYRDPRLYIHPNIPRRKADNAASVHGMDPRSILVLYDDGLGGGGKTGFAITDSRVYWRFISGSDPLYLEFRDIQSAIARKNKFLLNGYEVGTTMSSNSRHAAEVYADLMLELRSAFR